MAGTKTPRRNTTTQSRTPGPKTTSSRPATKSNRQPWTTQHERELKTMVREGMSAPQIAKKLSPRRSQGAVRQKCFSLGIALRTNRTGSKTRRAA